MRDNKTKKKDGKCKDNRIIFLLSLCTLYFVFLFQLFTATFIPKKFLVLPLLISILIIFVCWLEYSNRVNIKCKQIGKIGIVILSALLLKNNLYFYNGMKSFEQIGENDKELRTMSVVTLTKNDLKEANDLKDGKIGIVNNTDKKTMLEIVKSIKKDVKNISIREYTSYDALVKSLYKGETDAIVVNEAYRNVILESTKKFTSDTSIIYKKGKKQKIIHESKGNKVNLRDTSYNILISGMDVSGNVGSLSQSVTNVIASVNPLTKEILFTAIPSNYYVSQKCQNGKNDKLENTGLYGQDCSIDSIEDNLEISIDYYIRFNATSLANVTKALDGIDVDSNDEFSNQGYSYQKGKNTLHGDNIAAFYYKEYKSQSKNYKQMENQLSLLTSLTNGISNVHSLSSFKYVTNAISGNFQTNLTAKNIEQLLIQELDDKRTWKVTHQIVTGNSAKEYSPAEFKNSDVLYPDVIMNKKITDNMKDTLNKK